MSLPGLGRLGLRGRLALSIAAIVVIALAVTFVAVYRSTGSQLRSQIDRDLAGQVDALEARLVSVPPDPEVTASAAHSYLEAQPFGASASLLVVTVPGAGVVTNQPELLRGREPGESPGDRDKEAAQASELRSTPDGYSETELADAGEVRILTRRVPGPGETARAVIRAGEPLESVERAQAEVSRTFLLVGAITLLAAIAAGFLLASRTAAPLRRMARIAAEVDAGELDHRIGAEGARDEVRSLAESFDHMLDRLEDAFARQRGFVSDASHELRTPLTAVRGQLEVLARDPQPSPERIRETERTVAREVDRMSRLVNDLLALARIDEGGGLSRERFEVAPLLAELAEAAALRSPAAIVLEESPPGTLDADPDRIAQVLRNLISNAAEHAGEGGKVEISAGAEGGWLRVAVDDDGPGIPEAERERIFDRFHRAEASRTRRQGGGSGLGLAIARAIIEAHGGQISASESALGGARVTFRVPGYGPPEGPGS